MRPNSIALRLVVAALVWLGAALLVGSYVLSGVFRGHVENSLDDRLEDMLEALMAGAAIDTDGKLVIRRPLVDPQFNRPYSGLYWQIASDAGPIHRSRSLWDEVLEQRATPGPGQMVRTSARGPAGQSLRVLDRYVALPGSKEQFHFAVAADDSSIEREIELYDQTLLWSLLSLGFGLFIAILLQVRYGLRPMRDLRTQVAAIRSGRSDRLSGDFPQEVTPLVQELNALLEHNAAMVERAQTHVSDLAHALKTPLTVLAAEVQSPAGTSPEVLRQELAKIRRQVDHHLARAQTAASAKAVGVRTSVSPVVEAVKRTLERLQAERHVKISLGENGAAVFRGQREDLEEVVGNLVENGCKWARTEVRVGVTHGSGRVVLTIDDDGPGLPPDQRTAVLERGIRLDETAPGSGLGLAIVRDIVTAYGGKFHLEESPIGGLRATVALPSAE